MPNQPDSPRPLVVLVDDDPEILRSLGRLLRREAYDVLSTDRPAVVLDWARTRTIDLVIADQRMPDMSGTELLGILRDTSPATMGVILSGFPDTALVVQRTGVRIERLIAKPWINESLKKTIRDLIDRRTLLLEEKVLEIRVDCTGLDAGRVMAEIVPACRRAPADTRVARIVFDNLMLLEDSLARLLKDLARTVAWLEISIELRDSSGCVNDFLDAMGDRVRMRP